jgi:hypothetical protein
MLHEVEFADSATRALGIEHTPFQANFGFSPEEPRCSTRNLHFRFRKARQSGFHCYMSYMLRYVRCFELHKDEMQSRSKPSTAPRFDRGNKVTVVPKSLFVREQPN